MHEKESQKLVPRIDRTMKRIGKLNRFADKDSPPTIGKGAFTSGADLAAFPCQRRSIPIWWSAARPFTSGAENGRRGNRTANTSPHKLTPFIRQQDHIELIAASTSPHKLTPFIPHKKRALKIEGSLFTKSTSLEVIFQLQRTCLTCEVTADAQVIAECQIDTFVR